MLKGFLRLLCISCCQTNESGFQRSNRNMSLSCGKS